MPIVTIEHVENTMAGSHSARVVVPTCAKRGSCSSLFSCDGTERFKASCSLKDQPAAFEALRGLTQESSVIVTGKIHADKRAAGGFEFKSRPSKMVQRVRTTLLIRFNSRNTALIFF